MKTEIITYKSHITGIQLISKNLCEISIEKPAELNYLPGQFIEIKFEGVEERAKTISSINQNKNQIKAYVNKRKNDAFSDKIFKNFKLGEEVVIEGPLGEFYNVDEDTKNKDIIFIACELGFASCFEICHSMVKQNTKQKINFFWEHEKTNSYFKNFEMELQKKHSNFAFYNRKRGECIVKWIDATLKLNDKDKSNLFFFISSSLFETSEIIKKLEALGIDRKNIKEELIEKIF